MVDLLYLSVFALLIWYFRGFLTFITWLILFKGKSFEKFTFFRVLVCPFPKMAKTSMYTPPVHSSHHTCPVSWTLSMNYYWSDTLEVTEKNCEIKPWKIFEKCNFDFFNAKNLSTKILEFGLFWVELWPF